MNNKKRGLALFLAVLILCVPAAALADESQEMIAVYFTLLGDTVHPEGAHSGEYPVWIDRAAAEVSAGSTAAALAKQVLEENGYIAEGIENGYITSVISPEGVTLEEYTNGPRSGWLYMVDGEAPVVGMQDYVLEENAHVYLYYTDDYSEEYTLPAQDGQTPEEEEATNGAETPDEGETPETVAFADLSSSHWAYTYIMDLAQSGVVGGYADGTFGPENSVTRAEFTAMLARMAGAASESAETSFSDVPADAWFASYVAWGVESGVVSGTDAAHFAPEEPVSRQDICVMLWRYAQHAGRTLDEVTEAPVFLDQTEIADYAAEAVETLCRAGIVSGREDNRFAPEDSATRAETAKMLSVFFGGENE